MKHDTKERARPRPGDHTTDTSDATDLHGSSSSALPARAARPRTRRPPRPAAEREAHAGDLARRRGAREQRAHGRLLEDAIAERPLAPREIGAAAEARAIVALEARGYTIVARNWTCEAGELDVVARDGDVLVFVEVRSREDDAHGHAAEMVTRQKRAQVTKVAYLYLVLARPTYEECRFDVVAVTGERVEIIADAWRA